MDWVTYVPTITTGIVGLAGISAAILSARMAGNSATANLHTSINSATANLHTSIAAEDKRVKIAEKRRIYARYLASLMEIVATTGNLENYTGEAGSDANKALSANVDKSVVALSNAVSELQLIAPDDVVRQANEITRVALKYVSKIGLDEEADLDLYELRQSLVKAMRVDLGEPPS